MRPAAPRWAHVGLTCADLGATEAFYRRHFGFRRARVVPAPDGEVVFLRSGGVHLELFPAPGSPPGVPEGDGPHRPGAVRHLAFQVDDLEAFLAAAPGLRVTLGPLAFDEVLPGWRTVWVADPDGVVVEVSQGYTDQQPSPDGPTAGGPA